jgi:spermidine synthase
MDKFNLEIDIIFWEIIKNSGKNCYKINKIRKKIKVINRPLVKKLDSVFSKYHDLIWAKMEPILGDYYSENSSGFTDFVFYLLYKGKDKLDKFINSDYNTNYYKDMSKFNVEYKIKNKLLTKRSDYQLIEIFKTVEFGNMLVIDNDVQLTEADEKNYHEMIVHVPLNYFNNNSINVLIIGGGDGGTLREVLKHNNIDKIYMIEIDEKVIEACKEYLPKLSNGAFANPRTKLIIGDGAEFIQNFTEHKFDVVIIDSTDFNQANVLHTFEFYENLKNILNLKHLICFNGNNVNWNEENIVLMVSNMKKLFNYVTPFTVYTPTFAGGFYSFCLCSNSISPINFNIDWTIFEKKKLDLEYYNKKIHMASFALPNKLDNKLNIKPTDLNGVHYILNIYDLSFNLLNDEKKIDEIFCESIKLAEMKLLDKKLHQFQPQGLTGMYMLSTSHTSFHTYPEKGIIYIDLFSCGDVNKTKEAINYIITSFNSINYKLNEIFR